MSTNCTIALFYPQKTPMRYMWHLLLLPLIFACNRESTQVLMLPDPVLPPVSILSLGDSYTIGSSVQPGLNFPNQLADSLRAAACDVEGVRIIAQIGWRTDNLQNAIAADTQVADSIFDLVTLCIGVNNQYQNANFDTYKTQFSALLQKAIQLAGYRKERVFVISIPDWAYTPYGQNYPGEPSSISNKIDEYNAANKAITQSYQISYIEVTDISRLGLEHPELVAADGLHPSGKQYSEWVKRMIGPMKAVLK